MTEKEILASGAKLIDRNLERKRYDFLMTDVI